MVDFRHEYRGESYRFGDAPHNRQPVGQGPWFQLREPFEGPGLVSVSSGLQRRRCRSSDCPDMGSRSIASRLASAGPDAAAAAQTTAVLQGTVVDPSGRSFPPRRSGSASRQRHGAGRGDGCSGHFEIVAVPTGEYRSRGFRLRGSKSRRGSGRCGYTRTIVQDFHLTIVI